MGIYEAGDLNDSRTHPVIIEVITRCYASTLNFQRGWITS